MRARLVQVERMGRQRCSTRQVEDVVQETSSQQHKGGSSDHVLTTSTFPSRFVSTRPTLNHGAQLYWVRDALGNQVAY
jgi:hypothetical protein